MSQSRMYTVAEEIANAATHGVGLVLSLVALPVLIVTTAGRHDWLLVAGMSVFGATMIAVYMT